MVKKSTILHPWLRGVIEITGDHDTGKTLAMLQTVKDFSSFLFIDDDIKGDGTVKQMAERGEFPEENYIDLSKERKKLRPAPTPDELLNDIVFPLMQRITEKHYDVIAFDTWRIVYQAARGHVERNQGKYASVVTWRGTNQIIQGLISKVGRMIERDFVSKLKENCDLLLVSHHLKDNYVQNVNIGLIPESSATFNEVCNMRIWLRRNPMSKVPVMLFLKRPNIPRLVPGKGLRATNMVPEKITPTDKHESIWEAIAEYEKSPIESRQPRPDETPSPKELEVISGTLTEETQAYIRQAMQYNAQLEKELSGVLSAQETPLIVSPSAPEGPGSTPAAIPDGFPVNGIQLLSRAISDLHFTRESMEKALGKTLNEINQSYTSTYWETLQRVAKEIQDGNSKSKSSAKSKK